MPEITGIDLKKLPQLAREQRDGIDRALMRVQDLSSSKADKLVNRIHEQVFRQIDCRQCANCCKTTSPLFTQEDIGRISAHLGFTRATFVKNYLMMDEEGDFVFSNPAPCSFLEKNNDCRIYNVRPEACREYPHTGSLGQRKILDLTRNNAGVCPGVYQLLQKINEESGHQ